MKLCHTAILVLVTSTFIGCFDTDDFSMSKEKAYRLIGGGRIPDTVTEIQVSGADWMDYSFALKFSAPDEVIDQIIDAGYSEVAAQEVQSDVFNEPYADQILDWNPSPLSEKECWWRTIVSENQSQRHILIVDREKLIVYAIGEGGSGSPETVGFDGHSEPNTLPQSSSSPTEVE